MPDIRKELRKRPIDVAFPTGGLDRKGAYRQQKPYTTPDCCNVRAIDTIESRERGGSRPGLVLSHVDDLGASVRMLSQMTVNLGDGFTAYSDTFGGTTLSDAWTMGAWSTALPIVLPSFSAASISTAIADGSAVLDTVAIDTTKAYTVEMFLAPWNGEWHGTYRLYLRMANSSPDSRVAGVIVTLTQTGASGTRVASLVSVLASASTTVQTTSVHFSAVEAGWLSATVTPATNVVTVYWNGKQILTGTCGAQTGHSVGFGLTCSTAAGVCLANTFRVQYYSTADITSLHSILIASAGGGLFYESSYGRLTQLSTSLTLQGDALVSSSQEGQMLYIADYGKPAVTGTDGTVSGSTFTATAHGADMASLGILKYDMVVVISDVQGTAVAGNYAITTVNAGSLILGSAAGSGSCSYRIERAPKVFDPLLKTFVIMTATAGIVPIGCPLLCRYLDRMVFAGASIAPHVWYMSRSGSPLDWDYSQTDVARAVAGTASAVGVVGEPITALIAHSDDYLIIGCMNSLWKMIGDPANGGALVNLSHAIGIVGPNAWCNTPDGALLFLSYDGVYILDAAGDAYPVSVSRETLPKEFANLSMDMTIAEMEYDIQGGGVHIFLTSDSSDSRLHWWIDTGVDTSKAYGVLSRESRRSFWPFKLDSDHEPTATCVLRSTAIEDSGVILGGRDGFLRRFNNFAENDCGIEIESYIVIGPIALGREGQTGTIASMDATLAAGSGDIEWSLQPSLTFEGAISASASDSGTWIAGLNATNHPSCRGQAFALRLDSVANRRWAIEGVAANIREAGQRRIA